DTSVLRPVAERPAQGGSLHLLGRPLGVVARLGAVHRTTAGELGRTDRTLAGPAGALLAVRLLTTTADLTAGLGGVRPLPACGLLGDHDLVDQRDVDLLREDLVRELDASLRRALAVL